MSGTITVKIVRSVAEVEDLRDCWSSWQNQPVSDIDMYLAMLRSRPEILRPHIILLSRDGKLDAMLVGILQKSRMPFRFGYWKFLAPQARVLGFAYGGLLGNQSAENAESVVSELVKCLRENEAEAVVLHNIRTDSPLYSTALHLPGSLRRDRMPQVDTHCSMVLPSRFEEVEQGLSREHRKDIRRMARKLNDDSRGDLRVRRFSTVADLPEMIENVEEVAKETYQRALGVGFTKKSAMIARLSLCAQQGHLRTYVLFVSGQPCAFAVGTLYRGTYHTDYLGYSPTYAKYSPGTFLFMNILQDLCADGVKAVDFGYGDEMYKQRFGNLKWEEGRLHLFSTTPRGICLNVLRTSSTLLDVVARRILQRFALFTVLKTKWRKALKNRQAAAVKRPSEAAGTPA
jgi:hypothetical protein